jgi:hypothetical protein
LYDAPRNVKESLLISDSIAFFSEPDILMTLTESGEWQPSAVLNLPGEDFSANFLRAFNNNLYMLDSSVGRIIRYQKPLQGGSVEPIEWLEKSSREKPEQVASFAVDGQIWILKKDGRIQRYFKGLYQESIHLSIFPELEKPKRLVANSDSPYLYILDPENKRIVIATKFGDLVAQYKSPAFDNMLDLSISRDGRVIYVLNSNNIYRISTEALQ